MSRKSGGCWVFGAVLCVGLFLLCAGVLGVGALIAPKIPNDQTPVVKTPAPTPATPVKQAAPPAQQDDDPVFAGNGKSEHVSGHTNKNGKYVQPYNRRPK